MRAKQPYVHWANAMDDDGPRASLVDSRAIPTIYLVNELEGADLYELVDEWYWEQIFAEELEAWMTDASTWPQQRSADMFHEWFEVELVTMVLDAGRGRIKSK